MSYPCCHPSPNPAVPHGGRRAQPGPFLKAFSSVERSHVKLSQNQMRTWSFKKKSPFALTRFPCSIDHRPSEMGLGVFQHVGLSPSSLLGWMSLRLYTHSPAQWEARDGFPPSGEGPGPASSSPVPGSSPSRDSPQPAAPRYLPASRVRGQEGLAPAPLFLAVAWLSQSLLAGSPLLFLTLAEP